MGRDLNNRALQNVGIDQRIWILTETGGYGDTATGGLFPVLTNAIEHTTAKMEFTIGRENATHRSGRSLVVRLPKKRELKWSFESYIVPSPVQSGTNYPNLPDMHPFLLSAFGGFDNTTNPAAITYILERSTTSAIRVLEEGTHFSQVAVGCVADELTFTLSGDGKSMMKVSGFGSDSYLAGQTNVATTAAAGTSGTATSMTIPVTTGQGARIELNSYIDVISATDGNTRKLAAALVTGVVGDNVTVALPSSYAGDTPAIASGDYVIGAAPDYTPTSSAAALLGLNGTFTTDLTGITGYDDLINAEITLKNNYTQKNFNYGTDHTTGFIADKRREVSLKLDILLTQANWEFYAKNRRFIAEDISLTIAPQSLPGLTVPTVGQTFTFNFPRVEFNVPVLDQPADGYIKITLEGVALSTDINTPNQEMTLTIS